MAFEGFTSSSPSYTFEGGVHPAYFFLASGCPLGFLVTERELVVIDAVTNEIVSRIPLDEEADAP